jgi:hypothetical protein
MDSLYHGEGKRGHTKFRERADYVDLTIYASDGLEAPLMESLGYSGNARIPLIDTTQINQLLRFGVFEVGAHPEQFGIKV